MLKNKKISVFVKSIIDISEAIILSFILSILLKTFLIDTYFIPTDSMKDTIRAGDHILVNKLFYGIRFPFLNIHTKPFVKIHRGDILIFSVKGFPNTNFVKRCVGLPGEKICIKKGRLFINGKKVIEPYILEPMRDNFGEYTIPRDEYFFMGDNRNNSEDSRIWASVKKNHIIGKAFFIYWPLSRFQFIR